MSFPFNNEAVKAVVKRTTRALGYELISRKRAGGRQLSMHLEELFRRLEIDCVFDVGANRGQYRNFLRHELGYRGKIVSFEPIPENVEYLKEQARSDPLWIIDGIALGAGAGTRKLNVMKNSVFSSFLEPSNFADGQNEVAYRADVDTKTLEPVFRRYRGLLNFRSPYLKLDTQGSDLEILKGGRAVLPAICALQTEISFIAIYHHMPSYLETLQFLNEQGFDPSCISAVTRDSMLRMFEADCVMVNRNSNRDFGAPI